MKRFTILGGVLLAISGIAAAFTTDKSAPAADKFDLTGTCKFNGEGSVSCRADADFTASCLTSGVKDSENRGTTTVKIDDLECTLN